MAKMSVDGAEAFGKLEGLDSAMRRIGIRRIVEAGAKAAAEEMTGNIQKYRHVKTGSMQQNVAGADYKETFDGGEMQVYPQGTDSRGVSNAMKAYVINYGIGKNPTRRSGARRERNRTGDKFITGNFKNAEPKIQAAMAAEASAVLREATNTEG